MTSNKLIVFCAAASVGLLATVPAGAQPLEPTITEPALSIVKRLTSAMQGEMLFTDADFVKPLAKADKEALRRFGTCKIAYVSHPLAPEHAGQTAEQLERAKELSLDSDSAIVRFACPGVPEKTPVAITLHLQDAKIARIETHNADLMQAN